MASRECYLRIVQFKDGVEFIAGLELRPSESMADLRTKMKVRMKNCTANLLSGKWADVAYSIEQMLKKHWPDRAYFIEVGHEPEGWIQIFQPWGVPREDK